MDPTLLAMLRAAQGIPQSQQDLTKIASAVDYTNSPAFRSDVSRVTSSVETYVYAQLALQTLATAATFGMFLILLHKFMKERP